MSYENKLIRSTHMNKFCPKCNKELVIIGIYWCSNCRQWFEEIDFLDLSPEEIDEECKRCPSLKKTPFKKADIPLFYCNNMETERFMEKIKDFRKCEMFHIS